MVTTARNWALWVGGLLAVIMAWYGYDQASCLAEDCTGSAIGNAIGYGITSFIVYAPSVFIGALVIQWINRAIKN